MNTIFAVFISQRYMPDVKDREELFNKIKKQLSDNGNIVLICGEDDLKKLDKNSKTLIVLPASGSVQPYIIKAAELFESVIVFAGYVEGNFDADVCRKMLVLNAAPSTMEVYSVLKKTAKNVYLCKDIKDAEEKKNILDVFYRVDGSKLLLIGNTEPWVLSSSSDVEIYKKQLGITVEKVPLSELTEIFAKMQDEEIKEYFDFWNKKELINVDTNDVYNGARLNAALLRLIKNHNAEGAAVACFKLIEETKTTACLAASYINSNTPYVVACEGDADSLVTMFLVKALTKDAPWMANPNLQKDKSVNFVHCSAPVTVDKKNLDCVLRPHHETGEGVSTEVCFLDSSKVTAVRISDEARKITIQSGIGRIGEKEPSCHSQLRVTFDDYNKYIDNVLGCHQVFSFHDIEDEVKELAKLFGLEIL